MKSPIQKRVHLIKEVAPPSLTFQSEPHCGQCDIWFGGELAKEVPFIYVFVTILSKPIFVMFSGFLIFLFVKLLYYIAYFFKNCTHFFLFYLGLRFEKLKHSPILLMLDWFHAWLSG